MLKSCGRTGQQEHAARVLKEMEKTETTTSVISYSYALAACENGGHWKASVALLEAMQAKGLEPDMDCYNSVLAACEK